MGRIFEGVVGVVDGPLIEIVAPAMAYVTKVLIHYSESKRTYGINCQCIATADYCFSAASTIAPEAYKGFIT